MVASSLQHYFGLLTNRADARLRPRVTTKGCPEGRSSLIAGDLGSNCARAKYGRGVRVESGDVTMDNRN
jgi:hypothetical protein